MWNLKAAFDFMGADEPGERAAAHFHHPIDRRARPPVELSEQIRHLRTGEATKKFAARPWPEKVRGLFQRLDGLPHGEEADSRQHPRAEARSVHLTVRVLQNQ